jgi:putative endonuclease
MPNKSNQNIGKLGEELAVRYLQGKQYQIVERNYRWARGEIDIIASTENTLVFVEVKTARGKNFGPPETWVNERKRLQLGKVAERYLQEKEIDGVNCRFDVVAVWAHGPAWKVHHIENAFWL